MFKITEDVKKSLAAQIIGVANLGGAGLVFLLGQDIIKTEASVAFCIIVGWWLLMQFIGHLVLAYQFDPPATATAPVDLLVPEAPAEKPKDGQLQPGADAKPRGDSS